MGIEKPIDYGHVGSRLAAMGYQRQSNVPSKIPNDRPIGRQSNAPLEIEEIDRPKPWRCIVCGEVNSEDTEKAVLVLRSRTRHLVKWELCMACAPAFVKQLNTFAETVATCQKR